jgi:hypothetical protein
MMATVRAGSLDGRFRFDAERWASVEGRPEADRVRCPLCLIGLDRTAVETRELTVEHIVPRALGGRLTTLTCRRCNNTQGSRLDRHVVEAARARDASEGHDTFRTTVTVGGASLEAELAWTPDRSAANVLTIIPGASDPRQVQAVQDNMVDGAEVRMSFSYGYVPNRLWLGLLRAAYLCVFRTLGPAYALDSSVVWVRRQIREEDPPSPHLGRIVRAMKTPPDAERYDLVPLDVKLKHRTDRHIYLVLVQTRSRLTTTHAVALPRAGSGDAGGPEILADVLDEIGGKRLVVRARSNDGG